MLYRHIEMRGAAFLSISSQRPSRTFTFARAHPSHPWATGPPGRHGHRHRRRWLMSMSRRFASRFEKKELSEAAEALLMSMSMRCIAIIIIAFYRYAINPLCAL